MMYTCHRGQTVAPVQVDAHVVAYVASLQAAKGVALDVRELSAAAVASLAAALVPLLLSRSDPWLGTARMQVRSRPWCGW